MKNMKRIIGAVQILLCIAVVLMLLLNCLVIDFNNKNLKNYEYTGFEAYFGAGTDLFGVSVGGVMLMILLGLVVILAIMKIIFPKISVYFNPFIFLFAALCVVLLSYGLDDFMLKAGKTDVVQKFNAVASVKLGVGAIMGIIFSALTAIGTVVEAVISFRNR